MGINLGESFIFIIIFIDSFLFQIKLVECTEHNATPPIKKNMNIQYILIFYTIIHHPVSSIAIWREMICN